VRLNVRVERIIVEQRSGTPIETGAIAAALRTALEREFAGASRGDLHRAIERAVCSAFAPPWRRRT
jgi:hypothetical protein